MAEIITTNRRNATEIRHEIELRQSAKTGRYFFTAGDMVGYVPTKTAEGILGGDLQREDLQVADVSIDGGKPVTCLMRKGSPALAVL